MLREYEHDTVMGCGHFQLGTKYLHMLDEYGHGFGYEHDTNTDTIIPC